MSLEMKVGQYVRIRDAKAAMKKEFDKSTERLTLAMEKLEGELLGALQASEATSVKTKAGTAYISTQSTATVQDRDEFTAWCEAKGHMGAMDIRANKKAIRELLDEGVEVPGVSYSERLTIGVRRG
jgi:hypothetical protein